MEGGGWQGGRYELGGGSPGAPAGRVPPCHERPDLAASSRRAAKRVTPELAANQATSSTRNRRVTRSEGPPKLSCSALPAPMLRSVSRRLPTSVCRDETCVRVLPSESAVEV